MYLDWLKRGNGRKRRDIKDPIALFKLNGQVRISWLFATLFVDTYFYDLSCINLNVQSFDLFWIISDWQQLILLYMICSVVEEDLKCDKYMIIVHKSHRDILIDNNIN
jgi:hypothetical protein